MNGLTAPSNDRNWTFRCSGVSPDATIQPIFPSSQLMGPFRASVGSLGPFPGAHVSTGLARVQHVQVDFAHWALSKMTVCHCLLRSQNTQEMVHSLGIAQGSIPTSLLPSSKGVSHSFGECRGNQHYQTLSKNLPPYRGQTMGKPRGSCRAKKSKDSSRVLMSQRPRGTLRLGLMLALRVTVRGEGKSGQTWALQVWGVEWRGMDYRRRAETWSTKGRCVMPAWTLLLRPLLLSCLCVYTAYSTVGCSLLQGLIRPYPLAMSTGHTHYPHLPATPTSNGHWSRPLVTRLATPTDNVHSPRPLSDLSLMLFDHTHWLCAY